jgi:hypothetical protein
MARIATDQTTVLERVVARLIAQVDDFRSNTCFLTAQPLQEPPQSTQNNLFCTVSPSTATFEGDVFEGAGANGVFEDAAVVVCVYNAIRLDRSGHDAELLTHSARGLLKLKQDILKALAGHDLADLAGNQILLHHIEPERAEDIRSMWEKPNALGDMALVFKTEFEWDLS